MLMSRPNMTVNNPSIVTTRSICGTAADHMYYRDQWADRTLPSSIIPSPTRLRLANRPVRRAIDATMDPVVMGETMSDHGQHIYMCISISSASSSLHPRPL